MKRIFPEAVIGAMAGFVIGFMAGMALHEAFGCVVVGALGAVCGGCATRFETDVPSER